MVGIGKIRVNGMPEDHEKYVVARVVGSSVNELWYWGSLDNKEEDDNAAKDFWNGIVVEVN